MPVTDIYSFKDDALSNLFEAEFFIDRRVRSIADQIGLDITNMRLRVVEFTKPEISIDTYELHYKAMKAVKVVSKTSFANEFSLSIRVDRDFLWYKFFENWQTTILSMRTGDVAGDTGTVEDGDNYRTNIRVIPDGLGSTDYWDFWECFPKSVPSITFSNDSSEPIICEITFACNFMSTLM